MWAGPSPPGPTCWAPRWWSWGGHAPALGDLFVDEVRASWRHHVVPPIAERMRVGVGILGAQAPALGAAWGALDLLVETGALVQRRGGAALAGACTHYA